MQPDGNLLPLDAEPGATVADRAEAAERLSDNHEAAIADVLKNSGVQAISLDGGTFTVEEAIDWHSRLLAEYLRHPKQTCLPWGRIGGKDQADPRLAAVGTVTLAYLQNRICAPRDMSAGAATAFRAAIDQVLPGLY
jgi:glutathione S-transferase